ncbi:MAG: DUF1295 domain-containing protein [Candidatus Heimdallarchaeum aukensis]|uniref:DUF1295 domain-containing protein n=1 Tax=Candidatus Heimdallarchaeum aukensis TaxID=2876573 RepID=A0A9Y1BMF4_9ARCH|nr:MAG: DUF1295 domain-containing protein [Candidatus Heimdallarchaeum aukensis]
MLERVFFIYYQYIFLSLGIVTFFLLLRITAPYGKHFSEKFGPSIKGSWAWLIMESPAAITTTILFLLSLKELSLVPVLLVCIFCIHYYPRDFIYPFWARREAKTPLIIMFSAIFFNISNAYLQTRWLLKFAPEDKYTISWLYSPQFIVGSLLFILGFIFNRKAEFSLRKLRKKGESSYKIPYGGMFELISCPNYFFEIIEWIGWAIITWSIPGLVFMIWTIANLGPRAVSTHNWYKNNFPNYPKSRKALIPFVF